MKYMNIAYGVAHDKSWNYKNISCARARARGISISACLSLLIFSRRIHYQIISKSITHYVSHIVQCDGYYSARENVREDGEEIGRDVRSGVPRVHSAYSERLMPTSSRTWQEILAEHYYILQGVSCKGWQRVVRTWRTDESVPRLLEIDTAIGNVVNVVE